MCPYLPGRDRSKELYPGVITWCCSSFWPPEDACDMLFYHIVMLYGQHAQGYQRHFDSGESTTVALPMPMADLEVGDWCVVWYNLVLGEQFLYEVININGEEFELFANISNDPLQLTNFSTLQVPFYMSASGSSSMCVTCGDLDDSMARPS